MQWLEEDFEESCDFRLFGLTSHVGGHRLSWEMNRLLGWSLAFFTELQPDEHAGLKRFVVHRYASMDTGETVALVANRLPDAHLVRKLPKVDFLLQLGADMPHLEEVVRAVRGMRLVSLLAELDPVQTGALEHLALLDLAQDPSLD